MQGREPLGVDHHAQQLCERLRGLLGREEAAPRALLHDETGDTREAVAHGIGRTASIITGAAAIMVCVFGGMATGELVMFQQMGFGLAVAIFLDATVVRTVIVPAGMELLGDLNWYLPRWLEWLPDVSVEGRRPVPGRTDGRHRDVAGPGGAAPDTDAFRRPHLTPGPATGAAFASGSD